MDSESLAQVERIVTAAANGLRQDIAALRQSTDTTAAELLALRQSTDATAVELRNEMTTLRRATETTAEDIKCHTGVLIEGLRHDLQSVTDGFQMHLDRRHAEDREYMEREFREGRALLKLSYTQLHDRVEALDQRVNRIEQHLGLSA